MKDYIALTKPRITWLILMSTGVGYFFGLKRDWDGWQEWPLLLHTLVGTGLIASGTAALNQWYEREADSLMRRTAGRPLPSGKMTANRALWFGIVLAVAGFTELAVAVNPLTGVLGALTLAGYLFVYTPLKQRSHPLHCNRRAARRHAAPHGVRGVLRQPERGSLDTFRDFICLAISAFPRNCVDVSG